MQVVELVKNCKESIYPVKNARDFNPYNEYFLVIEGQKNISILRQIENKLYIISLTCFGVTQWEHPFEEIFDVYKVFCIPEYTGGSDGISENARETRQSRKELMEFLINNYV